MFCSLVEVQPRLAVAESYSQSFDGSSLTPRHKNEMFLINALYLLQLCEE